MQIIGRTVTATTTIAVDRTSRVLSNTSRKHHLLLTPVAERSKAWVCGRSRAVIAGSNSTAVRISRSPTECVDVSECDRMKQWPSIPTMRKVEEVRLRNSYICFYKVHGGVELECHPFITSALDVEWSFLQQGKKTHLPPLSRKICWHQGRSGLRCTDNLVTICRISSPKSSFCCPNCAYPNNKGS